MPPQELKVESLVETHSPEAPYVVLRVDGLLLGVVGRRVHLRLPDGTVWWQAYVAAATAYSNDSPPCTAVRVLAETRHDLRWVRKESFRRKIAFHERVITAARAELEAME